tara:strand:- start:8734 stop:9549 length:816 start_codon:yes stop_codon:yes gene_type:complete
MDCGKWESSYLAPNGIKILLFDIETTPMEVFVWGLFGNKYIQHGNVIKDWNVLSWSAKWLFDSEVISDIQTPTEAKNRDDKRVLGGIWDLINQANVVIAHNGDKFDLKKLNTRFHMNGYLPPSPYQSIDTLKVARRNFAFSSNRLDYLGTIMTNKGKISTNFQLWKDCLKGDRTALNEMLAYNEEDVRLLEEVYVELRPWIKAHPNVGVYMTGEICPTCGSDDIETNGGYYTTNANMYESYRCGDCGSLSRKLKSVLSVEDRRELMRPLPR